MVFLSHFWSTWSFGQMAISGLHRNGYGVLGHLTILIKMAKRHFDGIYRNGM